MEFFGHSLVKENIEEHKGFGGDGGGVTPVPIPNTEVKPTSADGTWVETPWESRSPPDFANGGGRVAPAIILFFVFCLFCFHAVCGGCLGKLRWCLLAEDQAASLLIVGGLLGKGSIEAGDGPARLGVKRRRAVGPITGGNLSYLPRRGHMEWGQ